MAIETPIALTIVQGTTFSIPAVLTQSDRVTPIDLTGSMISAIINTTLLTVTVADPASGMFVLSLTPTQTQALPATRRYGTVIPPPMGLTIDIRITWADNRVDSLVRGRVEVEEYTPLIETP